MSVDFISIPPAVERPTKGRAASEACWGTPIEHFTSSTAGSRPCLSRPLEEIKTLANILSERRLNRRPNSFLLLSFDIRKRVNISPGTYGWRSGRKPLSRKRGGRV
jgi:hypothetical protein